MSSRAPQNPLVKPKSVNPMQTQDMENGFLRVKRKDTKTYRPTNAELMDPESRYFTKDWWTICEILHPNPWADIVSDFSWSTQIIDGVLEMQDSYKDVKIGHFPEGDAPADRLNFAIKTYLTYKDSVEDQISAKIVNAQFLRDWGEYQKAVAMLASFLQPCEVQNEERNRTTYFST